MYAGTERIPTKHDNNNNNISNISNEADRYFFKLEGEQNYHGEKPLRGGCKHIFKNTRRLNI